MNGVTINLSLGDWIGVISLIFAIIGGVFAFCQWRKSIKVKRAEFIFQLIDKIRFDNELANARYLVDYDSDWYNNYFHAGDVESQIDKLFSTIEYICYLYRTNNVSKKEFNTLKYDVHRLCVSPSSQAYLWNLYHFSMHNGAPSPFQNLIEYGLKYNLLPSDFKSNNRDLYKKRLNF